MYTCGWFTPYSQLSLATYWMYKAAVCVGIDVIYSIYGLGCEAAIVWRHCKWHLTDKWCKRSRASPYLHCCTAPVSNVQKSTVCRNPHNTVVKLRPYPFRVRELQHVEKKNWKKRTKSQKNAKELLMLHFVTRMVAAVIHCITVYNQPSPSLHRQHYCAIWCVGVMSCTLSCLPARPLPSNRHHTCSLTSRSNLWPPCLRCARSRKGCGGFLWIAAATEHLAPTPATERICSGHRASRPSHRASYNKEQKHIE